MSGGVRWVGGALLLTIAGGATVAGCFLYEWDYRACSDGAGAACGVAPNLCPGGAVGADGGCVAEAVCGDGKVEGGEACDDGNTTSEDGCSASCEAEPLDTCPGLPVQATEELRSIRGSVEGMRDDHRGSCSLTDYADVVYAVTPIADGTLTLTLAGSSDKALIVRSACADKSLAAELACRTGSETLRQELWVTAGATYYVVIESLSDDFKLDVALSRCNDGDQGGLEQCDGGLGCNGCVKCAATNEFKSDGTPFHACYRFVAQPATWLDARRDCIAWGGDLVGLSSIAEYDFVTTSVVLQTSPFIWTGGYARSLSCDFTWADGEPWFARWAAGEPDSTTAGDSCVELEGSSTRRMRDTSCSSTLSYICERSPAGSCGNGKLEIGEECDDAAAPTGTCKRCRLACADGELKDELTHHCYRLVEGAASWDDASQRCAAEGGYLAVIGSEAENEVVRPALRGDTWIGGRAAGGEWTWSSGDPFCFATWSAQPPTAVDGQCVSTAQGGLWLSAACDEPRAFLCERGP